MGIKGIYGEIGSGQRVALSKLSIEHLEKHDRPLRIAIDISIWLFQVQSGRGGTNPALRTLYFRLLRLLSLSIQPLFVFDGPHKPPFKRNKRTGVGGALVPNMLAKQLLKYFGFSFHMAPGEAEAECALLQREGIVDAVFSEDVDTLMFGCGLTIRNWSTENSNGSKSPTHVDVYDAEATKNGKAGLDREGMILIALMSGGDYIPEGIPGCGIKVACEAARAGFGKTLCSLARSDTSNLTAWREELAHEMQTNESKYFRVKHKSLQIPKNFPNVEALGYYTHPVVSNDAKIQSLKQSIDWNTEVDVQGLRQFVTEAFEWTYKGGAKQLVRGLAPAMLIAKLWKRSTQESRTNGDLTEIKSNEGELIEAICGRREHFSNDGLPELRVIYTPIDITGLDLDIEEDDSEYYSRSGLATNNEDEDAAERELDEESGSKVRSTSPAKRRATPYDPTKPEKLWVPETMLKLGVPLTVENYEESLQNPKKSTKQKFAAKKAANKGAMPKGALDKYLALTKPGENTQARSPAKTLNNYMGSKSALPPAYLAPVPERPVSSQPMRPPTRPEQTNTSRPRARSPKPSPANMKSRRVNATSKTIKPIAKAKSPWEIPNKQSGSSQMTSVRVGKTGLDTPEKIFRRPVFSNFDDSDEEANVESKAGSGRKHTNSATSPSIFDSDTTFNPKSSSIYAGSLLLREVDVRLSLKRRSANPGDSFGNLSAGDQLPGSRDPFSPDFDISSLRNVTQRSRRSSPTKKPTLDVIDLCSSPLTASAPPETMASPSAASSLQRRAFKDVIKNKRYFMVQESLDGAWKEVDESQIGPSSRAWCDIEVVDLTAD